MFYHSKTLLEFGCNSLFYTNLNNGFWDYLATLTMQCQIPELVITDIILFQACHFYDRLFTW